VFLKFDVFNGTPEDYVFEKSQEGKSTGVRLKIGEGADYG
jgi:hypothetical protein